jgi:hypothetical protein
MEGGLNVETIAFNKGSRVRANGRGAPRVIA